MPERPRQPRKPDATEQHSLRESNSRQRSLRSLTKEDFMEPKPMDEKELESYHQDALNIAHHALTHFNGELLVTALEASIALRRFIWAHYISFPEKK